jgi:hypothetical protein
METITVVCRGASTEELAKLAATFSSFRELAPNVFHGALIGKFSIDLWDYVAWAAEPFGSLGPDVEIFIIRSTGEPERLQIGSAHRPVEASDGT